VAGRRVNGALASHDRIISVRRVSTTVLVGVAVITPACSTTRVVVGSNTTTTTGGSRSCVGPTESFTSAANSMAPTITAGQSFTVDLGAYKVALPKRGDIVLFTIPPNEIPILQVTHIVKRIVGLPGEAISSGPLGEVLINGKAINQPWLTASARSDPGPPIRTQMIPDGHIFVMGDNRGDSDDSRDFGPILISSVIGKVVLSGCG
jgi:signal peptidase I